MLDKNDIDEIRSKMEKFEEQREQLIRKARDVVKFSKQIVYAVHRGEINVAGDRIVDIKKAIDELNEIAEYNPKLVYTGSFKVAIQEYVEAICYYEFVKDKKMPSRAKLKVGGEYYLLGLCDLTGELVRKAVNAAIEGQFDEVVSIKELVAEIYGELLKFDFRENEIRKKFDSIKYDLKKLEDLVFELKVKEKL